MTMNNGTDTIDFRSHLEETLAHWFDKNGIEYEYESHEYSYTSRVTSGRCEKCGGPAVQDRTYTPDFFFPKQGFYLEAKGQLTSSERKKYRDFKRSNPEVDLRFLFAANNKLQPSKPERYSDWAAKFGFPFSIRSVDAKWFGDTDGK